MDRIITGGIALAIFVLFVGGLAVSIHQHPFTIIFVAIAAMAAYGLYEEVRDARRDKD